MTSHDTSGPDPRLQSWWADQSDATRIRLSGLPAGQTIPPAIAWSLGAAGFPARPMGQGAYEQPPELTEFLAGLRGSAG